MGAAGRGQHFGQPVQDHGARSRTRARMRFGVWYHLRNPERWRQPPETLYARTLDQIVAAEALGFDSAWTSEHHFVDDGYLPSTLLFLAAVAARTKRMRI